MIEFDKVQIGYNKPLLKVTVANLEKGKSYALIGPNGSGKSTFLKTIIGQLATITGSILIGNKLSSELSAADRSKAIVCYC